MKKLEDWKTWISGQFDKKWVASLLLPVVVTLTTTFATMAVQEHIDHGHENSEHRISEFRDDSRATFESCLAAYVRPVIDGQKPDPAARERLVENILHQLSSVEDVAPLLKGDERHLTSDYSKDLLKLRELIAVNNDILELRPFWEQVSRTLVTRNDILQHLEA